MPPARPVLQLPRLIQAAAKERLGTPDFSGAVSAFSVTTGFFLDIFIWLF
jgi:hypothetical protein